MTLKYGKKMSVTVYFHPSVFHLIEKTRGKKSRSEYITEIVEEKLDVC